MSVVEEYFKLQQEYEKKYGPRTVVLMQIGSFYEMYEYNPLEEAEDEDDVDIKGTGIGWADELHSILGMRLAKKDGTRSHSKRNPFLVGFPCVAYEDHRDTILSHGFTIVRIVQKKEGKNVERYVKEIVSPGTCMDQINIVNGTTNQVVSIYIECKQKIGNKMEDVTIIAGLSCIDVLTGKSIVCETYSKEDDPVYGIHEIYRFLVAQRPHEIIINVSMKKPIVDKGMYKTYLTKTLELNKYPNVLIKFDEVQSEYFKHEYQKQFLSKLFVGVQEVDSNVKVLKRNNNIVDELKLEKYNYGIISYLILLQYCYEHNDKIVQKIQKPDTLWTDESKHLILTYNAIIQLNIVSESLCYRRKTKTLDSLLSVVDNTSTSMGKRLLRNLILNPITDIERLNQYYDMTEELVGKPDLLKSIEIHLKKIKDVETYQRKLCIGEIKPYELSLLFKGYLEVIEIMQLIDTHKCEHLTGVLMSPEETDSFAQCIQYVLSIIDLDKLYECNIHDNRVKYMSFEEAFVHPTIDANVDAYVKTMAGHKNALQNICTHLESFFKSTTKSSITYIPKKKKKSEDEEEENSKSKYMITVTASKAKTLKNKINNVDKALCGELSFENIKKDCVRVISEKIKKYCYNLENDERSLGIYLYRLYSMLLDKILDMGLYFTSIVKLISTIDYIKSNAKVALKYKYFKPCIVKDSDRSFVECEDLRHPLSERLIEGEYIANTFTLNQQPQGILVYGMNSCGKSTLTKSIGLNIIMAQAGMFTAGKIRYHPYRRLITRLSGHDDIIKGHSSFVVEMLELKAILNNADEYSLMLMDEISKGTESISGTSIVGAAIIRLLESGSSFISSTHLHIIPEISRIQNVQQGKLQICHLSTENDKTTNTLIYHRKLEPGSGENIYGLEVCHSLGFPHDFMELAHDIRKEILKIPTMLMSTKKSPYSSKLYVDQCNLCGSQIDLESHHIRHQREADSNGFIGYMHKDISGNLIILCDKCHQNLHGHKIEITNGQTINGQIIKIKSTVK